MHAAKGLERLAQEMSVLNQVVQRILRFRALADRILEFWLKKENRETLAWLGHRDINMVMLATSLIPDGYLGPLRARPSPANEIPGL